VDLGILEARLADVKRIRIEAALVTYHVHMIKSIVRTQQNSAHTISTPREGHGGLVGISQNGLDLSQS
jgi:hypothetical protein